MGKQALTWIGVTACSALLLVAGGLLVGAVAVHRFVSDSTASMHGGFARVFGDEPTPMRTPELGPAVTSLSALPGVRSVVLTSPVDVFVTMDADARTVQTAAVVDTTARLVTDDQVRLEVRVPAGSGHGVSVAEFEHFFGATVTEEAVLALSSAVHAIAAVPGVASVRVSVPPSWKYSATKVQLTPAADVSGLEHAVVTALAATALKGASVTTAPLD